MIEIWIWLVLRQKPTGRITYPTFISTHRRHQNCGQFLKARRSLVVMTGNGTGVILLYPGVSGNRPVYEWLRLRSPAYVVTKPLPYISLRRVTSHRERWPDNTDFSCCPLYPVKFLYVQVFLKSLPGVVLGPFSAEVFYEFSR